MGNTIGLSDYKDSSIEKSMNGSFGLEKGGEGSRGGHVIGHTRSGKAVYADQHPSNYKDFSDDDHMDASKLHKKLIGEQKTAKDTNVHAFHALDHINSTSVYKKFKKQIESHLKDNNPEEHKTLEDVKKKKGIGDRMQSNIDKQNKKFSGYGIKKAIEDKFNAGLIDEITFMKANIQLSNLLEKAGGEGSRGGKVIGHTRSGKAVYQDHGHEYHGGFSASDHLDASSLHMAHQSKLINENKTGTADTVKNHYTSANYHHKEMAGKIGFSDESRGYGIGAFTEKHLDASQVHAGNQVYDSKYHHAQMKLHQSLGDKAKTKGEREGHYEFAHSHFKKHNERKFHELMDDNSKANEKRLNLLSNHRNMTPGDIAKVQGEIDSHHREFVEGMNNLSTSKFKGLLNGGTA